VKGSKDKWREAKIVYEPDTDEGQKEDLKDYFLMLEQKEGRIERKIDEDFDEERFRELLRKDEKLRKLFKGELERKGKKKRILHFEDGSKQIYDSRSEAEHALIHKLLYYEIPEDQIRLIMQKSKIGKWNESHQQYRDHTFEKAKRECKKTISTDLKKPVSEVSKEKSDLPFFRDDGKFVPLWMAKSIMNDYHFVTHEDSEELYVYDGGIYEAKGEMIVKQEAQKRLGEYVKTHYINESVEAIRRANYTPSEKFNNPKNWIVVENGVLNINTRELKEHSPEHIHLAKIPWKYDPDADCPKIKQFVSEVVNEDDVKLVQEMFGYCLLKDYPFAKAFMLLGSGANGKSTLLKLLERFFRKG